MNLMSSSCEYGNGTSGSYHERRKFLHKLALDVKFSKKTIFHVVQLSYSSLPKFYFSEFAAPGPLHIDLHHDVFMLEQDAEIHVISCQIDHITSFSYLF